MLWLEVNAQALTTAAGVWGTVHFENICATPFKELAVSPQGLGFIKWKTSQQGGSDWKWHQLGEMFFSQT